MLRKIKMSEKGQSFIEFALMLPILLLVVLGIIEFGRIFLLYTEASNASREAARYGVAAGRSPNDIPRYLDCSEIRQAALDRVVLSDFDPITNTIEISYDRPYSPTNSTEIFGDCEDGLSEDDIQQGYRIVVTVTATFEPLIPIIPIPEFSFSPASRRTILKDILIQEDAELPAPIPGCVALYLDPSPNSGGDIIADPPPDCGLFYVERTPPTQVTLLAQPNSGYNFLNWGGTVGGGINTTKIVTMDMNHTAIANFETITCYELQVNLQTTGPDVPGTVDRTSNFECAEANHYVAGKSVILQANENVGYTFDQWLGAPYDGNSQNPLEVVMNSDLTLTADYLYTPDCWSIIEQIFPADEGTIQINPPQGACPGGWVTGAVTLTAVPDVPAAYTFQNWGGDAASCGTSSTCANLPISSDLTVSANFTRTAQVADVFVVKGDSEDPATQGQPFDYTLTVGNSGPDAATDVQVLDNLPASVTPVTAVPSQGSCNIGGNIVDCTIGFLAANTSASVVITVIPNSVGTIQNQAFVTNDDPNEIDTNPSNNSDTETTQIAPSADLSVSKSGPANSNVGATMTYNIVVSNTGPANATNVVLVDALPLTVSYLNSTSSSGFCSQSGTQLTCVLGDIQANGPPVNITVNVIATTASTAVNQATVSSDVSDPDISNNSDTASTVIGAGNAAFITLNPTCSPAGGSVTVKGYNWPDTGNTDTTIFWETVNGTVLTTVTAGEVFNGLWTKNVNIPATATDGLHTIVAYHSQGNSTTQASATLTVPCPAPDLIISSPTLISSTPVHQGDTVVFQVTVTNTNSTDAVSLFPVSLYFNPNPEPVSGSTYISETFKTATSSVSGLDAGDSEVVTLTAWFGFPITGTNSVFAVVDSDAPFDGTIDETIETNNISQKLDINVLPCNTNCGGGGQTGNGILAGQAFVPSVSGELLPQPWVSVILVGPTITQTTGTFTDQNGTYVISGLATGNYTVSGCILISGTSYFFAAPVTVVSGLVTQQDLLLTQGPCS